MRRLLAFSIVMLAVSDAPELAAQLAVNGATVRVRLHCTTDRLCARFVAVADSTSADSVTLRTSAPNSFRVAWRDIVELGVSQGARRRPLRSARAGATAGLIVGGVVAFDCWKENDELCALAPFGIAVEGFAVGFIVGLLVKRHVWTSVEIPPDAAPPLEAEITRGAQDERARTGPA